MIMDKPWWMWASFLGFILLLLALDLGVFHKKAHTPSVKESLLMCGSYVTLGILYGFWVWFSLGSSSAELYWTGFFVEKTLSLDNIFVISLVFTYFKIPVQYQHRVLFWGILGAIVLRGVMIMAGAALIQQFQWILYLFSAFLVYTGVKMLFSGDDDDHDISQNPVLKFFKKRLRVTDKLYGQKFFTRRRVTGGKKLFVTPLFLALIVVEFVDVLFAVDSIPAIFALTTDPYIIFTSNIFAILGLRALYFGLEAILHRFEYLQYALAMVLVFIGSKHFIMYALDLEKFPTSVSFGVTMGLIAGGVLYSLYRTRHPVKKAAKKR